jgi:hypothetical protein
MPWEEPPDEAADAWKRTGDDSADAQEAKRSDPGESTGEQFDFQKLFQHFCRRYPATWTPLEIHRRIRILLTDDVNGKNVTSEWEVIAEAMYSEYCAFRKINPESGFMRIVTGDEKNKARNKYLWQEAKPWLKAAACISAPIIAAMAFLLAGAVILNNNTARPQTVRKKPAPEMPQKRKEAKQVPPVQCIGITEQECSRRWGVIFNDNRILLTHDKYTTVDFAPNHNGISVKPGAGETLVVSETYPDPFRMGMITRSITISARGKLDGERREFRRGNLLEPR